MPSQILQSVKKKIYAVCPELMELSFGCEVDAYGEDGPELEELKIEDIGIGWLQLPEEPNSEFEWFVSFKDHSPFEVFVCYP